MHPDHLPQTHPENRPKFSYGIIPQVARALGISPKAAQMRVRSGNVEALRLAIRLEERREKERERLRSKLAQIDARRRKNNEEPS
jgi:hypothetical protein